jgi:gag-polyprotein putative aspartyl protease
LAPLTGIVDSGADGTLVPMRFLSAIQAPPTSEMFLRSQWGERRAVWLYLVDVQIGSFIIPGIEVVGDESSDEIVLGRDVLRHMRIILDGPQDSLDLAD